MIPSTHVNEKVYAVKLVIIEQGLIAKTIIDQNVPELIAQEIVRVLLIHGLKEKFILPPTNVGHKEFRAEIKHQINHKLDTGEVVFHESIADFIQDVLDFTFEAMIERKMLIL